MSAKTCPRCAKELPEATLQELERGTPCPFCGTPLKRLLRRATGENNNAWFQGSATPVAEDKPSPPDAPRAFRATLYGAASVPQETVATPRQLVMPPSSPPDRKPAPVVASPAPALRPAPPIARTPAPVVASPAPVAARRTPTPAPTRAAPSAAPVAARRTLTPAPTRAAPTPPPALATPAPRPAPDLEATPPPRPLPRPPVAVTAIVPSAEAAHAIGSATITYAAWPRRRIALSAAAIVAAGAMAVVLLRSPTQPRAIPDKVQASTRKPAVAIEAVALATTSALSSPPAEPAPPTEALPLPPPAPAHEQPAASARSRTVVAHVQAPRRDSAPRAAKVARHKVVAKRSAPTAPAEPGDPREAYDHGNTMLFAGDGAGAVAAYREAVRVAPADPIGYRGLGLAYEQQGETVAALRALRQYLKLAPDARDRTIITRRVDRLARTAAHK